MNFLPIPSLAYFLLVWKMKPSELHMDVCLAWNAFLSCWTWAGSRSLFLRQQPVPSPVIYPAFCIIPKAQLTYSRWAVLPSRFDRSLLKSVEKCQLPWMSCVLKMTFWTPKCFISVFLKKKKILKKILQNRIVFMLFFSLALIVFDWAIALQFCEK